MVIKMLKRMFRTHLFSLDIEQSKDGEEDNDDDDHYDDHRLWVGRGGVHLGQFDNLKGKKYCSIKKTTSRKTGWVQ